MPTLELRIPPPVLTLLTAAFMGWLAFLAPWPAFDVPGRDGLAIGIALAGFAIALLGVQAFRRARTTVNPLKPETASSLVTHGVYRLTRNPMYLGMLLTLVGWAVHLGSALAVIGLAVFVLAMNRLQIGPEERFLAAKFGPAFAAYRQMVRRWL